MDGQLLVTLFRGVPFAPNTSTVVQIEGTLDPDYLVLQHSSGVQPFFAGPGVILRFDTPGATPTLVADCFVRPTAMLLDRHTGTAHITESLSGRLLSIALNH